MQSNDLWCTACRLHIGNKLALLQAEQGDLDAAHAVLDAACELADTARSRHSLVRAGTKPARFCHITAARNQPHEAHAQLVADLLEDEELLAHLHADAVAQRYDVGLRRGVQEQAATAERAVTRAAAKLETRRAQVCCAQRLSLQSFGSGPGTWLSVCPSIDMTAHV